ncbi:hydroxyisourate hydrolase [Pseudomonas abietaniphila]|jgi:5-hydroxyisourate hydrolase
MKRSAMTLLALLLGATSSLALAAAGNPLSVHVLNLENGLPSPGVKVELEQKAGDSWRMLSSATTDEQGRISALYPDGKTLEAGAYRVVFKTGEYFKQASRETFFPEIPVIFEIKDSAQHYHIPLLLSPYGFSTYRGS